MINEARNSSTFPASTRLHDFFLLEKMKIFIGNTVLLLYHAIMTVRSRLLRDVIRH